MNTLPWYLDENFWQGCYSVLFTEDRFAEASVEIKQVLSLVDFSGATILDMPCGPGRHSVLLAQQEYRVTGVDRSGYLLSHADEYGKKSGVNVEWINTDMRDFTRNNSFDLALNLFSSFGYFENPEDDRRLLKNFFHSLKPGGTLVLDLKSREILTRDWSPEFTKPFDVDTRLTERLELDPEQRWIKTEWIVTYKGEEQHYRFKLRLYSAEELTGMLADAGFVNLRMCGSLGGETYSDDSSRLVIVGEKP